jgi:hypothetical protein
MHTLPQFGFLIAVGGHFRVIIQVFARVFALRLVDQPASLFPDFRAQLGHFKFSLKIAISFQMLEHLSAFTIVS